MGRGGGNVEDGEIRTHAGKIFGGIAVCVMKSSGIELRLRGGGRVASLT